MIELKNVSKYYHSGDITNLGLHNVSLKLNKGEIVAITGDSGSGKSTLLNVITKIDSFDEGEILFKGNETSYFSVSDMDDFRKNKIGFIFQNYNIIDSYTVLENVMLPLTLKGLKKNEAKHKALELIEKVGLSHRVKSRGTKLSGGEKQRCVIARALASDCEILACDEPTGNLDSKTGDEIIKLIKEVAKDKLVLIVTHNYDQVKDIVTRKIRVADGEIVEDVYFEAIEDDQPEELDLDYVPLKKSVCGRIAKNNVLFTPRKTILLALIFFAICLSQLFLFQTINNSYQDVSSTSVYVNDSKNRIVVYDANHKAIDENLIKGYDYDKNAFNEDFVLSLSTKDLNYSFDYTYSNRYSFKLKKGEMPKNNREIVVLFSQRRYSLNDITNPIGKFIVLNGKNYTISGYALMDINETVITGNEEFEVAFYNKLLDNNIAGKKGDKSLLIDFVPKSGITKPYIEIPKNVDTKDLSITLFNTYDITNAYEIKNSTDDALSWNYVETTLYYPENKKVELPLYEASIYAKRVKSVSKAIIDKGLDADICSQVSTESKAMKIINNFISYLMMGFASLALIIVFLITYVILARVYQSKKKDYEILRTLGVTKKDMRLIVDMEVIGVCGFVEIFSLILFVILLLTVPTLKSMGTIQAGTIIIYLIATLLFAYCLARRFNKRLFKFSVTKSMKGDVKND